MKDLIDYQKLNDCLNFMDLEINGLEESILKKRYYYLAKKFHPDLELDFSLKQEKTIKFQKLNDCYRYISWYLECKFLFDDISVNDIYENDVSNYEKDDVNSKEVYKYYQDVINRLDRLIRPLNKYCSSSKIINHIISNLLFNIEILKKQAAKPSFIFDYGTLANYCDLIEVFVLKVFNLKIDNVFDIDKNNFIDLYNDEFVLKREEVCLLEKRLLYKIIAKIIDFIVEKKDNMDLNDYEKNVGKYLSIIDDIIDSIASFKWELVLPKKEIENIDIKIKKIRKYEEVV